MNKYSFLDDYSEGCHPQIIEALAASNLEQQVAYGNDDYTKEAKALISDQLGCSNTSIYFVSGGTQANIIIASSVLRSHEAIIAASSGHIVLRETGAIEATGHKIITVDSKNGKLTPDDINKVVADNAHAPHMVKPRLVYISNATEAGTLYTRKELQHLSHACKAHELLLLMDGARLGVALSAPTNDLTLSEVAVLTDIFWLGGTKAGALMGEAIIIPNKQLAIEFSFHIKQRGALLAKGRLLGVQFKTLFTDQLFFRLCQHANMMAQRLSEAFVSARYRLSVPTESNQIFPILPNTKIEALQENFDFYIWAKLDDHYSVIRLVTSWATDEAQVEAFIEAL